MADTANITTDITDGLNISSDAIQGVDITTNVVEGTVVTADAVTGARGEKGETGDPGPAGADAPSDHTLLSNIGTNTHAQIDTAISNSVSHIANTSNPHNVTKEQVGLSNVPNTDFTADVAANTAKISFDAVSSARLANTSGTNTGDQDLSGYSLTSHNHTGVYAPVLGADDNYVTDAEKVKLANLSGTNTGDQDLSGYVPTSRTVNTKALSSNIILNQDDIGDGTTYKQYSATEKTKLSGIAVGATANSSDATLLSRANHTGTQTISTILSLQGTLDSKAPASHTHTASQVTDFDTEVSNNTDVVANTSARHTHANAVALAAVSGTNTGDNLIIGTTTPTPSIGAQVLWLDTTGGNITLNLVTGE